MKELFKNFGEKIIVIDEFYRFFEDFFDFLYVNVGRSEKDLVFFMLMFWFLLWFFFKKESFLFGVVLLIKIGFIDEREVIIEFLKEVSGKEFVEVFMYFREFMFVFFYKLLLREFMV